MRSAFNSGLAIAAAIAVLVVVLKMASAPETAPLRRQVYAAPQQPSLDTNSQPGPTSAQPERPTAVATYTECDRIAADPDDPNRARIEKDGDRVPGAEAKQLELPDVLQACSGPAVRGFNPAEKLRAEYQLARAQMQGGQYQQAMPIFRKLCAAQYGVACLRLAKAYRLGMGGVEQDDFASYDFARRAQKAGVAAAGEMAIELEPLVTPWTRVQAKGLLAPLIEGKLDQIPDTVSTRRYFYTLFVQGDKQNSQWYVSLMSNQDHLRAREVIWPVLEERLRLTADEAQAVIKKLAIDTAAISDWRGVFEGLGSGYFNVQTAIRNANSVQVVVGAQDAQKLFEWFSGCGSCSARERYQRNLAQLMARWNKARPAQDTNSICQLLFGPAKLKCLPLEDYEGADAGGQTAGVIKRGGGNR